MFLVHRTVSFSGLGNKLFRKKGIAALDRETQPIFTLKILAAFTKDRVTSVLQENDELGEATVGAVE